MIPIDMESTFWRFNNLNEISNPNDIMQHVFVNDYIDFNSTYDIEKEIYDDMNQWINKHFSFNLNDGIVIGGFLNNLDKNINGIYRANEESDNYHEGLFIFEFEEKYYYIIFSFKADDKGYGAYPFSFYGWLVSKEKAYKKAFKRDNFELANLIDDLNEGTFPIDKDKKTLEDKRERLIHQLKEIDAKLSKKRMTHNFKIKIFV